MVPGVRLIGEVLLSWLVAFGTAEGPKPPAPSPAPAPAPEPEPRPKVAYLTLPADVWAPRPKPVKPYEFVGPPVPPKPAIVCDFTLDPELPPKPEPRPPEAEPPKPAPQWWSDSTRPGIEIFGVLDDRARVVVEKWRYVGQTEHAGFGPMQSIATPPLYYQAPVQWYFSQPGGT